VTKKEIKLQHRTYLGADHLTQYIQHRINIPDEIIKKLQWTDEDHLVISIESRRKGKKRMTLKSKNQ